MKVSIIKKLIGIEHKYINIEIYKISKMLREE